MTGYKITKASFALYILVILFNISSWIDNDGVYAELPILVQRLPESWALPSYLTIAANVAAVCPLLYFAINTVTLQNRYEVAAVYFVILTGLLACILLIFFWNKTAIIAGKEHSVALLALTFVLSLTDSSSSVVFLGYMSRLPTTYMTAYYIGDGMCGFLPSIVALIQGAGDYDCVNSSSLVTQSPATIVTYLPTEGTSVSTHHSANTSEWHLVQVLREPLFSVEAFLGFLCAMLAISGIGFSIINYCPTFKNMQTPIEHSRAYEMPVSPAHETVNEGFQPDEEDVSEMASVSEAKPTYGVYDKSVNSGSLELSSDDDDNREHSQKIFDDKQPEKLPRWEVVFLLCQYSFQQGVRYGLLYSIQSYSLLPYGKLGQKKLNWFWSPPHRFYPAHRS